MVTKREKRENRNYEYEDPESREQKHEKQTFGKLPFTLPEGFKQFTVKSKCTKNIDVIPYVVGDVNQIAKKGKLYYELTYYRHDRIGPDNKSVLCNWKNFGTKCAVCTEGARLRQKAEWWKDEKLKKQIQALNYKERQLMFFRDRDNREEGIQVFETANYKSFGAMLDAKSEKPRYRKFWFLKGGMYLEITFGADTFEGHKFYPATSIDFIPREKDLSESLIAKTFCFDELIRKEDQKKLAILLGKSSKSSKEDDDEDEDEDDTDDEDEDQDDDLDDDPDEDATPRKPKKPARKKPGRKPKPKDDEEDDDDSDDEDDEDEEEDDTSDDDGDEDEEDDSDEDEDDDDEDEDQDDDDEEEDDEDEQPPRRARRR